MYMCKWFAKFIHHARLSVNTTATPSTLHWQNILAWDRIYVVCTFFLLSVAFLDHNLWFAWVVTGKLQIAITVNNSLIICVWCKIMMRFIQRVPLPWKYLSKKFPELQYHFKITNICSQVRLAHVHSIYCTCTVPEIPEEVVANGLVPETSLH